MPIPNSSVQSVKSLVSSIFISVNSYMNDEEGYSLPIEPFLKGVLHSVPFIISSSDYDDIRHHLEFLVESGF